jgi:SAM-dependent methyltransferase
MTTTDNEQTRRQGRARSMRRTAAVLAEKLGAERVGWRLKELSLTVPQLAEAVQPSRRMGSDGLPLPPPLLRVQVNGSAKPEDFLEQGRRAAGTVRSAGELAGRRMEDFADILDFGCGSGRVLRQWVGLSGPALWGSDYNPKLVAWSQEHLPFASVHRNELEPPLPFADGQFDFVYALSVFTHLAEPLQRAWIDELRRVLRPGGILAFSTRGDQWAFKLNEAERRSYAAGDLVVRYAGVEGTNLCAAFHPRAYVDGTLARGWTSHGYLPAGLADGLQDVNVLERTD